WPWPHPSPPAGPWHQPAPRRGRCSADVVGAEVADQRLGHGDRAVGALVGLEDRDDRAADRAGGAVQRVHGRGLAVGGAVAALQPAGLVVGAVGGAGELAVALLPGQPHLVVVLARRAGPEVADRDV